MQKRFAGRRPFIRTGRRHRHFVNSHRNRRPKPGCQRGFWNDRQPLPDGRIRRFSMAKKDELLRTASTPRRSERKHTTHNTPMAPAFGRHCVGTDADPSKRTAPSRSQETRAEPCARRYGRHPLRPFRLGPAVPGRGRLSEPPLPLAKSAKQRRWHAESTFGRRKGCRSPVLHFAAHTVFVEDLRPRPLAAQKDHDESGAARVIPYSLGSDGNTWVFGFSNISGLLSKCSRNPLISK